MTVMMQRRVVMVWSSVLTAISIVGVLVTVEPADLRSSDRMRRGH